MSTQGFLHFSSHWVPYDNIASIQQLPSDAEPYCAINLKFPVYTDKGEPTYWLVDEAIAEDLVEDIGHMAVEHKAEN